MEAVSSGQNLRTRHVVVTGDPLYIVFIDYTVAQICTFPYRLWCPAKQCNVAVWGYQQEKVFIPPATRQQSMPLGVRDQPTELVRK
jgi:hypothetical protein